MALLVRLRLLEVGVRMGEVGAAVLPVAVQEQIVQAIRQVVVVGDVRLRPRHRIVLVQTAQQRLPERQRPTQGAAVEVQAVGRADVHEVVERALLDRERARHVGLAEMQERIERQAPMQRPLVQPDGRLRAIAAHFVTLAIGVDDRQPAPAHEPFGHLPEQHGDHVLRARWLRGDRSGPVADLNADLSESSRPRQIRSAAARNHAIIDVYVIF